MKITNIAVNYLNRYKQTNYYYKGDFMGGAFVSVMIKMFFLLTPFFALSMFLTYTADYSLERKRRTAVKTTFAVMIITLLIYWFGEYLFKVLGITIDAFRIGAGTVLLLTAISLVNGSSGSGAKKVTDEAQDLTVLRTGGDVEFGFTGDGRHFDDTAVGGDGEVDRHIAVKVAAVAFKYGARADVKGDVEVTGGTAVGTRAAHTGMAQL